MTDADQIPGAQFAETLKAWMKSKRHDRHFVAHVTKASAKDVENWEDGLDLPLRWQFKRLKLSHSSFSRLKMPPDHEILQTRKRQATERAKQREQERTANEAEIQNAATKTRAWPPESDSKKPKPAQPAALQPAPTTFGAGLLAKRQKENLARTDVADLIKTATFKTTASSVLRWEREGAMPKHAYDKLVELWPELAALPPPPFFATGREAAIAPVSQLPLMAEPTVADPAPVLPPKPMPQPKLALNEATQKASAFLRGFMDDRGGKTTSAEAIAAGAKQGLSEASIKRAKLELGISHERVGNFGSGGYWQWVTPKVVTGRGAYREALEKAPIQLPFVPTDFQLKRYVRPHAIDRFRERYLHEGPNGVNAKLRYSRSACQYLIDWLTERSIQQGWFEIPDHPGETVQIVALPGNHTKEVLWAGVCSNLDDGKYEEMIFTILPSDAIHLNNTKINTPFKALADEFMDLRKQLRSMHDKVNGTSTTTTVPALQERPRGIAEISDRPPTPTPPAIAPLRPVNPPQTPTGRLAAANPSPVVPVTAVSVTAPPAPTAAMPPTSPPSASGLNLEQAGAAYGRALMELHTLQGKLATLVAQVHDMERAIATQQAVVKERHQQLFAVVDQASPK